MTQIDRYTKLYLGNIHKTIDALSLASPHHPPHIYPQDRHPLGPSHPKYHPKSLAGLTLA